MNKEQLMKTKIEYLEKKIEMKEEYLRNAYKKFGRTFQHFVPFTENFPGDKWSTVFVGDPIDFICFNQDKIIFIEVKTGKAVLTPNQIKVKELIRSKKIEFREVRYND